MEGRLGWLRCFRPVTKQNAIKTVGSEGCSPPAKQDGVGKPKYNFPGFGEVAEVLKCLPCKNENLNSMPGTHVLKEKAGRTAHICLLSNGEVEANRFWGLTAR